MRIGRRRLPSGRRMQTPGARTDAVRGQPHRPVRGPRVPRGWRHGRGLPGPRPPPRARRRAQGPPRRCRRRPRAAQPFPARGPRRRLPRPPPHPRRPRHRLRPRRRLRRLRAAARPDPAPKARVRSAPRPQGRRLRRADLPGTRGGARARRRPPRPQAREPVPDRGRPGQDPRLRPREADRPLRRRVRPPAGRDPQRDHGSGAGDGDGRVHVARAGARAEGGRALGHLRTGGGALRDAVGTAGLRREHPGGHRGRGPAERPT
jgi:hypothetical protein